MAQMGRHGKIEPSHYDVIVVGTGFPEAVVAGYGLFDSKRMIQVAGSSSENVCDE